MSVGHTARVLEETGITTVSIFIRAFRHNVEMLKVPRSLITRHILGRTVGAPGDVERQTMVIKASMSLLENAQQPGIIEEMSGHFRSAPQH